MKSNPEILEYVNNYQGMFSNLVKTLESGNFGNKIKSMISKLNVPKKYKEKFFIILKNPKVNSPFNEPKEVPFLKDIKGFGAEYVQRRFPKLKNINKNTIEKTINDLKSKKKIG